jgi:hypothetical protein
MGNPVVGVSPLKKSDDWEWAGTHKVRHHAIIFLHTQHFHQHKRK